MKAKKAKEIESRNSLECEMILYIKNMSQYWFDLYVKRDLERDDDEVEEWGHWFSPESTPKKVILDPLTVVSIGQRGDGIDLQRQNKARCLKDTHLFIGFHTFECIKTEVRKREDVV